MLDLLEKKKFRKPQNILKKLFDFSRDCRSYNFCR